jgi:endonuclease/exonuclease/phosphatase family metal-dependent hydrolase
MTPSAMIALPDSRIGLQAGVRDAYGLPVVVTHLSSGAAKLSARTQQLDRLVGWSRGFGEPLVLLGDFNSASDAPEMQPIVAGFRDAWEDALRSGRATGALTQRKTRIDYIFYLPGTAMTLESAEFVDTAALIGVLASDHQPVVATFTVR